MNALLKYVLIWGVIGAIVGVILATPIMTANLKCPIDPETGIPVPCMGSPSAYAPYGLMGGLIVGILVGMIIYQIKKSKKRKK